MDPAVWAQHSDFAVPRTGTKFEQQETRNIFEASKKKESVDSKIIANNYVDSVMRLSTGPIKFHLASDIVYFIHFLRYPFERIFGDNTTMVASYSFIRTNCCAILRNCVRNFIRTCSERQRYKPDYCTISSFRYDLHVVLLCRYHRIKLIVSKHELLKLHSY